MAAIALALLAAAVVPGATAAGPAGRPAGAVAARQDQPPRKVLVGTVVSGYDVFTQPLERRLQQMDEYLEELAGAARQEYPGRRLDLVVLPEYLLGHRGDTLAQKTVRLGEVLPRISAAAKSHGCYLVVPMLLHEESPPNRYTNAAVLVDREGREVGIYRKVHPVAPQNSDVMEGGLTPGRDFPVFQCDFGRVGIQTCFDMLYPDGWQALADQGADIVALPSASPETVHPIVYAVEHGYYIVSATPRDHSAVYNPVGMIEAEVTQPGAVLVHEIDLSWAILHWDPALDEGAALRRRFGDKVGYHWYHAEDNGLFWSNDPAMPIGRMLASLHLSVYATEVERQRQVQDRSRGGPPATP